MYNQALQGGEPDYYAKKNETKEETAYFTYQLIVVGNNVAEKISNIQIIKNIKVHQL